MVERDGSDADDFADPDLGELLGRYADDLTGRVDVEGALDVVQRRARTRHRWRVGTSTVAAAAAAVVLVAGIAALGDDGPATVQTPAATGVVTAPSDASTVRSTTPVTAIAPALTTTPPTAGVTAAPTPPPAAPEVAPTMPSSTVVSTTQAPMTTTFSSVGGSIVVRAEGGAVALDRDPSPTAGWTSQVDDDGPTRVRVRFERDGQRSEIRVDLRDGELVPEIVEQ